MDKALQRQQTAERVKRYRDKQKSVTSDSVTPGSVTLDEGQRLHPGAAPGARILSDGQLWYPGNKGFHPAGCGCGIKHA